ncbi:ABC transporter, ATP-binding protein [Candidatus Sulfobium mesophilum]|uniref:ABC transporter, ATP-binding protein n=1 Tax=Candidatus Sulfobium mesophilum TaxID=2016548 RepID=A0A2U3QDU4_9BACT|nr:ABC transporter, ATP-binding protein [Candidatus Sulfobium mesophilum]
MIKIVNLKKGFGRQEVLNGLNLKILNKELVAVIGRSGGGKSVLLKHLIGIVKPDHGKVLIEGVDITSVSGRELDRVREKFGVVFQEGALFDSLTVYENIAFPLREKTRLGRGEIEARVNDALEDVGLKEMGDKYPAEISGGMKRRVALARALITEPSIVLFDEPTTGLDPIISSSIHKLIKKTHRKYKFTGVIISHEIPEIFDVADKVAMLYNGTIIEFGTPEEFRNSENPYVRQFISGSLEGPIEAL